MMQNPGVVQLHFKSFDKLRLVKRDINSPALIPVAPVWADFKVVCADGPNVGFSGQIAWWQKYWRVGGETFLVIWVFHAAS